MAADVDISINAIDNFTQTLSDFGNIITGIKSAIDLVAGAFDAARDAIEPFVNEAADAEVALSGLDTVLRSTAPSAGIFQETIGRLSNTDLSNLYDKLEAAKDKLGEMREEFGNARTYTEAESVALAAQQDIIASLTAQIERGTNGLTVFRDTTQLTRDQLIELANATQLVTQYSDEQILAAETILLRYENINSTVFPQAIQLTTDLAQSWNMDLPTAAQTIGRAFDNIADGSLSRLNSRYQLFTDEQLKSIELMAQNGDEAGAMAAAFDILNEKVGGAAEAFGETFAGKVIIAQNALSDLMEKIGGPFIEILKNLLDWFTEFANSPAVQGFVDKIASIFSFLEITLENSNGNIAAAIDRWFGGVIQLFNFYITGWLNSGGPEELTDNIVSWVRNIGTNTNSQSFALIAAQNILTTLAEAFNRVDWARIGEALDLNIAYAINQQDWAAAGDSFGDAIVDFVVGGAEQSSTGNNASLVSDALALAFNRFLRGMVGNVYFQHSAGEIAGAIWQLIVQEFSDAIPDNLGYIMFGVWVDIGKDMVDGLVAGLNSFEINITDWVRDHIVDPIKRFLGIASPSRVFMEIGKDITQGLWDGIEDRWDDFSSWILSRLEAIVAMLNPQTLWRVAIDPNYTLMDAYRDALGSSGGSGVPYSPGGYGPGGYIPPATPSGGTPGTGGGNVLNFYGPVYVGSIDELMYDCAQTNPLLQAGIGAIP